MTTAEQQLQNDIRAGELRERNRLNRSRFHCKLIEARHGVPRGTLAPDAEWFPIDWMPSRFERFIARFK